MQVQEDQRLREAGDLHFEVRIEDIVEPGVWIPEFPGDDPELEYTRWRDLLFVHRGSDDTVMRREA